MAEVWTDPRTWVASEYVTAPLLNTHLRNNMEYLYGNLIENDGWLKDTDLTWTYASASSFSVAGNKTGKFPVGTRIYISNNGSGDKRLVVTSSVIAGESTTVNVTGGSDYALEDFAIAGQYYSYSPIVYAGNNGWFNWAPTQVGFSADPAGGLYRFRVDGNVCTLAIRQPAAGTSNANTFTISLPVTAKTLTDMAWVASGFATDNGTLITGMGYVVSAGTVLTLYKDLSATGWTTSGNKYLNAMSISYEI